LGESQDELTDAQAFFAAFAISDAILSERFLVLWAKDVPLALVVKSTQPPSFLRNLASPALAAGCRVLLPFDSHFVQLRLGSS
jgi:hypothetical protein